MKNKDVVEQLKKMINRENVKLKIMIAGVMFEANRIENINGSIVIAFDPDH